MVKFIVIISMLLYLFFAFLCSKLFFAIKVKEWDIKFYKNGNSSSGLGLRPEPDQSMLVSLIWPLTLIYLFFEFLFNVWKNSIQRAGEKEAEKVKAYFKLSE